MNQYIQDDYQDILEVYSDKTPNFIVPFFQAEVIKRISDIGQNCGTEFCKLYDYKIIISRLEHSLGVAMIIWNFTHDKKQTLSGLFHDISHSVFSHVGDFILGDAENQETSEQHTHFLLKNDQIITNELAKMGIILAEVEDYELYPIADNHGPQLAADRLEYNLSSPIALSTKSLDDIRKIYNDIVVIKNEHGEDELSFQTPKIAEDFGLLSIQNDKECFSSAKSVIAQSFLAEILKKMLQKKLIGNMELYTFTDSQAIDLMENSNDAEVSKMWNYYKQLSSFTLHKTKPKGKDFYVSSKCKKRFVDPLIKTSEGIKRLSSVSKAFVKARDQHLSSPEQWISIDYEI